MSLTALAEAMLARAKRIDAWLQDHGESSPSFDNDTLDALPEELQGERWALANSANDMKRLARGAETSMVDDALSWTDTLALRIVNHYKLAQVVPLQRDASYAEISAASGLLEDLCRRFLRLAMGNHVFAEDDSTQRVRHTAASRCLAINQGHRDAVGWQCDEMAPAASKLIATWEMHGQDVADPSKSAFSMYNESQLPMFAILASESERAARFGRSMGYFTKGDSWNLKYIVSSFDWASLDHPGAVVIDVGGGNGQISQYIAKHTTNVHFIVQDLPHVAAAAPALLPKDYHGRIEFAAHDFMTPQSASSHPAAFLLRWVLHNWADEFAVKILQNLTPSMSKGSKVLIYEYVLQNPGVTDMTAKFGYQLDAIMATGYNAQERTRDEYHRILQLADSRFVLEAVRRPPGSTMSMVEVGWSG